MSKPDPKRIDVNPAQAGLNSAFAGLDSNGLPAGSTQPIPAAEARPARPAKFGRVVLRRETAHRGGKSVVVVYDFAPQITGGQIEALGRELRAACGCGGTVKDRRIEIQGEQAARVREFLEAEGFRVAGVK